VCGSGARAMRGRGNLRLYYIRRDTYYRARLRCELVQASHYSYTKLTCRANAARRASVLRRFVNLRRRCVLKHHLVHGLVLHAADARRFGVLCRMQRHERRLLRIDCLLRYLALRCFLLIQAVDCVKHPHRTWLDAHCMPSRGSQQSILEGLSEIMSARPIHYSCSGKGRIVAGLIAASQPSRQTSQ
jgi:hypothetical protein